MSYLKKIISILTGIIMLFTFTSSVFASTAATVTKSVQFRSAPSTGSSVYSLLKTGTKLEVLKVMNKYWLQVQLNGNIGYVSTNYVTTHSTSPVSKPAPKPAAASTSSSGNKIVNTAKSFQGKVSYKFGTRDVPRLVFDCSSFTQYVFKLNGIDIPWGSKAQAKAGTYISKSNLQPGDLIFTSVSTKGQINHVGIYIGNGQFINNLPKQGVVISDLNSSYWTSHYITARRVSK
jgi:cell wall-associated NlpC family hydrolase